MLSRRMRLAFLVTVLGLAGPVRAASPVGYYREPALHDTVIVFVAEGDLWKVSPAGGVATRLTSHPGDEGGPAISPDGGTVAFTARYEGPTEVYTMPLGGGRPTRWTFDASRTHVVGWTPDSRLIASTGVFSTLPNTQLTLIEVAGDLSGRRTVVPLAQASDGTYDDTGKTLFFTRLPFQGSHTKRYRGGTAQNLWRFADGDAEATPLTADYAGTSKRPMWWNGRVYFASDRDGTMNLWSMDPDGGDLRQHTEHAGWAVKSPSLRSGRIAYQLGADIHVYDIASDTERTVPITLDSDFDQTRENWVDEPVKSVSSVHLSPDGDRVVLTARGRVFVAPHRQGRFVEAVRSEGVRYRDARFLSDGKSLLALSDESGEVELWTIPANGVGSGEQLTTDGDVLRWQAVPSPDGTLIAHHDKNQRLFIYNVEQKQNKKIDESRIDRFGQLRWSPDSKWLAYVVPADNMFQQVRLYSVSDQRVTIATTDRFDTYSPAWSPDGKWLYVLSDRNLRSVVGSPWGNYQPEPFLDKRTKIYQIALTEGLRSPFAPKDELFEDPKDDKKEDHESERDKKKDAATDEATEGTKGKDKTDKPAAVEVKIELAGLRTRVVEVPVPAGNYGNLSVTDKALYWTSRPAGQSKRALQAIKIGNDDPKVETVLEDVRTYELSADGKKLLLRKGDKFCIVDAAPKKADLKKKDVNLSGWTLSVSPREEWRQMFAEAWRLERDYFYDRGMHGVDWKSMFNKYVTLIDRITTRAELSDLIAQMVAELSALHIFVRGGDLRSGEDNVQPASLGAQLVRDETRGGYRVDHIYRSDPDELSRTSPLRRPNVNVEEGDIIEMINGTPTLSVRDPGLLLRHQADRQVLLQVKPVAGGESRQVIVKPMSIRAFSDLRYHEWEYTRRLTVDELGGGDIGYVHLRAMGNGNYTEWAKGYFPVFTRKGLIVDVRHNRGGNIDSWILNRLLRKVWFYWSQRVGNPPSWNMQYAFRGHVVVLCNERTASDGEAFSEGIKRLNIGKVIGTRTWGGEIWLTSSNVLVDRGIATAAEFGVYGPEGDWLIEGHGVEPDIVVDNLPHATFKGEDAQLTAAIRHLQKLIAEQPIHDPVVPEHPDKSIEAFRAGG